MGLTGAALKESLSTEQFPITMEASRLAKLKYASNFLKAFSLH